MDFQRLHVFQRSGAFFVVRVKKGVQLRRRCSHPADAGAGVISDHTVVLTTERSAQHYPDTLRRVRYHDVEHDRRLSFLTNNFDLPALTVALLYKSRWKVELFFKWIKQHLRIKAFYGTSENAVKTQIWTAVSVYVLVAILKKRLGLGPSLHQILQVLDFRQQQLLIYIVVSHTRLGHFVVDLQSLLTKSRAEFLPPLLVRAKESLLNVDLALKGLLRVPSLLNRVC